MLQLLFTKSNFDNFDNTPPQKKKKKKKNKFTERAELLGCMQHHNFML